MINFTQNIFELIESDCNKIEPTRKWLQVRNFSSFKIKVISN